MDREQLIDDMREAYGLEWKETLFGPRAQWSIEPDIAAISTLAQQVLKIPPH